MPGVDPSQYPDGLMVGLDVGSTTVKAVVMDPRNDEILWKDYERHQTKQPEKVFDFLQRIEQAFLLPQDKLRIFITGSGGGMLSDYIGAKFVQEVNAVSLAVEKLYPDAGSVIDKINAKLQLTGEQLAALEYYDVKLHPVAGKCGVFAETDINGLQKQGVPAPELMASLFEAIVQQNLSVLTRGNTLRPQVLLLGGPNTFIPAMRDCWKHNIPQIWKERNYPLPEGVDPKDLIIVPENAQYYAAIGSVLYGKNEDADVGVYKGSEELEAFIENGRTKMREASGDVGLVRTKEELEEFKKLFPKVEFQTAVFSPGQEVKGFIGVDGGSTSTKAVLMDAEGKLLAKAYQLSKGNPLSDTKDILADIRNQVEGQGATLTVLGVGTTGYAKDMLRETLNADVAIVETVAHTKSALHYYDDVDVIVDVGGQDIKLIVLKNGKVKDFKLNTQCSAGNGYFLQSTAARFGYSVAEFADVAFEAERIPVFSYGCAVFMETDIVNFQQLGWEKKEVMGGLAKVLPKNIWLYVVAEPNLGKFGTNFVLQGGTQHNLAAVKSQYDFIKSKVPGANIRVHAHTGESGAIGAALEAIRVASERDSSFIGLAAAENLEFTATREESTRCNFCKNKCLRTFIDTKTPQGDSRRFIIATCEKGAVEKMEDMKEVKARIDAVLKANPNFVEKASVEAFRSFNPPKISSMTLEEAEEVGEEKPVKKGGLLSRFRKTQAPAVPFRVSQEVRELRQSIKIGMPRVLNMYSLTPLFSGYLEALGVSFRNLIYSDYTDPTMWYKGSRRGSIDQCFPSKVAIAHIHNLLYDKKQKPDVIFFPIVQNLATELTNVTGTAACPTVSITPEVVKAAFTKEEDIFAQEGVMYLALSLDMSIPDLFAVQMYETFKDVLKITPEESREALDTGFQVWKNYYEVSLRAPARKVIDQLEKEGRVGIVMLGRPYHNDPGLNHEIMVDLQKRGYPIFSVDSLPHDQDLLDRLFGAEVEAGIITDPKDITDVWKNCYSENTSKKVWAAKYVARHPNLVAIDLSSFKCGHDAPIYNTIENIIEATGTPYFTFHDIDESKPSGSIKIRVETIDYFLQRYQEFLQKQLKSEMELKDMVEAYKAQLQRMNARALEKVEAAGHVTFGGSSNGHNDHPVNGAANGEHEPAAMANGSGNGKAHFPRIMKNPLQMIDPPPANGNGNGHHHVTAAYDTIRTRNTADDAPEEEQIVSGSASCGSTARDWSPKAFKGGKLLASGSVLPMMNDQPAGAQPQMIELVMKRKNRKKEEAKTQ
ncbi:MAG: CoA activase [Chloroflexi bacterium]|nr:CoA activase [Chloroflexota bacterium]